MKPETVGMSSARLARLDDVMKRRYVDGGYLPGMLTYVYRKGHLVHTGKAGGIGTVALVKQDLAGIETHPFAHERQQFQLRRLDPGKERHPMQQLIFLR